MASYYYLISSLPMLRTNAEPPLDYPAFLDMCKTSVSASAYRTLENLTVKSDKGPLLSEWAAFYQALTEELNYQRNQKLGRPGAVWIWNEAEAAGAAAHLPLRGREKDVPGSAGSYPTANIPDLTKQEKRYG